LGKEFWATEVIRNQAWRRTMPKDKSTFEWGDAGWIRVGWARVSAEGREELGSGAGAGARLDLISVVSDGGDAQKAKQHVGEKA
jgi:hypothetical protein